MVDKVPSVLVESMSRDIKILRRELAKANAKNDELEAKLEGIRRDMTDWMAEMDTFKAEMKRGSERQDVRAAGGVRNTILLVSDSYLVAGLALTENGARTSSDDHTEHVL